MTTALAVHAVVTAVLLAIVGQTLLNLARFPRLGRMAPPARRPRIAVLIPARNEAARIGACVMHWARQDYPDFQVLVYDDDSTDETPALAEAVRDPRVRVVRGGPLPPGWRGKPHACHRLRQEASAEVLLFADVDVTPAPSTLTATAAAFAALAVDALSALPRHVSRRLDIRTLVAIQNWAPLAFAPLWAARLAARPLFAVMTGQFLAIRAAAYDASGGFAAVRESVGEDAALGRRLVAGGASIALVDGTGLLTSRPYASIADLWSAHVRNLGGAFFGSGALLVGSLTALAMLHVAPPLIVVVGLAAGHAGTPAWTWLPLGETALALLSRALTDVRAGYGLGLVPLHPLAVLALLGMAVDATLRTAGRRTVGWRGRRYGLRDSAD